MDMLRITAQWTGFPGGPGYSNFYFAGGGGLIGDQQQVADRVLASFGMITDWLPDDVTITLQPEAEVIDSDSGVITGYRGIDNAATVSGTAGQPFAGPTGAVVNWRTDDLRNGRRIRGRTFIVPLVSIAFDNDGTLAAGALTDLREFADNLVGGDFDSELGVWSRPVNGSGGVFATATGYSVPDLAAVLRSRRD